jgi:prefoldin subunit 5
MITWWEALMLCVFIGWIVEQRVDKVTEAIKKSGKDLHEDIKELTQAIERQARR